MEVWANLKAKLIQRQMVVYQPWSGPRTRHTSHEKDYFEQRKSMIKFLQEYSDRELTEDDEQILRYLNSCPLDAFIPAYVEDHELDNWEKKIKEFVNIEVEPTNQVLCDWWFSVQKLALTALDWIKLKKKHIKK